MDKALRIRVGFLYVIFFFLFLIISLRLVQLQLLPNEELDALASKQFNRVGRAAPFRWSIFDRNGEELAVSMSSSSVFARPRLMRARRKAAYSLSQLFGGPPSKWLMKLDPKKSFVWIQRQIDEEVAVKLAALGIPGVYIEPENRRLYPNAFLAAPVLGFTDIDGNGLGGVELSANRELLDTGNRVKQMRDGRGNLSYLEPSKERNHRVRGTTLTLDRRIQSVLEEELEKTQRETKAKSILGVVMDPQNGEILAMGQYPSFDPNEAREEPKENLSNKVISNLYEPGSTLKAIFAAEAMQGGLLNRESPVNCEQGRLKIGEHVITEAEAGHHFGVIPLWKVIQHSSNVGAAKVAQMLGGERIAAALQKYGLSSKTGISLPGEAVAPAKGSDYWKPIHVASVGFGQAISVTPLQMVTAFSPFANGGYLVTPTIIKGEKNENSRRQVLSAQVASEMKSILLSVVESPEGTGHAAKIPGMRVAGKTGTAQKYEAGVGYSKEKYFASFIGFLPAEKPELLIGVMVDEPKGSYYAAATAAPLFRRVAERSLSLLGKTPLIVQREWPRLSQSSEGNAFPPTPVFDGKTMPDLRGTSMREALKLLAAFEGEVTVEGSGYLLTQSPAPGSALSTSIHLQFSSEGT